MINRDYQYVRRFQSLREMHIEDGSLYLYGNDKEYRSSACANHLRAIYQNVTFIELEYVAKEKMRICSSNTTILLKSEKEMSAFFGSFGHKRIYIDVTGMAVQLVASLLLRSDKPEYEVHVIYSEPAKYLTELFHKEGEDHEWAGNIEGIEPLPGFINFANPDDEFVFCVFLGFEGGRFAHLITQMQPLEDLTIPVYGIPGFRIEYPYNAYWSNQKGMRKTRSQANVRYASANSIVDAYLLLEKIASENENLILKIAPIGTKPHAVAALVYAIRHFKKVEVVYDNPNKCNSRSEGIGHIFDCNVTKLLEEHP